MNKFIAGTVVVGAAATLLGCAWKDYRDYCDKCDEEYSEDGCKAQAKAEWKAAKILGCKSEFKDLAKCLGDVDTCNVDEISCADEYRSYNECTCRASRANPDSC